MSSNSTGEEGHNPISLKPELSIAIGPVAGV